MGIKFFCIHCDRKINVKNFLAEKKGRCPHCEGKIRIPKYSDPELETPDEKEKRLARERRRAAHEANKSAEHEESISVATASPRSNAEPSSIGSESFNFEPLDEAPASVNWYVAPNSGGQYGPADGTLMKSWIEEGRVGEDSLVWRDGWDDWESAKEVFFTSPISIKNGPPPPPKPAANTDQTNRSPNVSAHQTPRSDADSAAVRYNRNRNRSNSMGVMAIFLLIFVAILLIVFLVVTINWQNNSLNNNENTSYLTHSHSKAEIQ